MDAPKRGGLTLVRLIGVMLVVATILELGLYWAACTFAKPPARMQAGPVVLRLIPAVLGFGVLFKARAIAAWLDDLLDQ